MLEMCIANTRNEGIYIYLIQLELIRLFGNVYIYNTDNHWI